jgi:hypothetical protein
MGFFSGFFQPPNQRRFAELLIERLQQAGDPREARFDESEFRIFFTEDGKDAGIAYLSNLYKEYCQLPKDERPKWWSAAIRGALAYRKGIPDDYDDAKPDLRPAVRSRSHLEATRLDAILQGVEFPAVPYESIGDHLAAAVVYDLPESIAFVNQDQLDRWEATFYEAMETAKQNLLEVQCNLISVGQRFYSLAGGDAYDASRLVLIDRIRDLEVEGEHIAMAVNRNTLLLTGSEDDQGLSLMATMAEKHASEPRPLCPVPLRLSGDEWETWLPPVGHADYLRFKELEIGYLTQEYAMQKQQLDALYQKQKSDQFVATLTGYKKPGELVSSYAVWTNGVATHLPKADEIIFFSKAPAVKRRVPWQRVLDVVSHLMRPEDAYPPRWLVDEFPTEEQLKAMGGEPF